MMDSCVPIRGELKAAMAGRVVEDNARATDDRVLRLAPRRGAQRQGRGPAQTCQLPLLESPLFNGFAKPCLVNWTVAAAIKIRGRPILDGAWQTPCLDDVMAVVPRHHRESLVADPRGQHSVAGATIFSSHCVGHCVLLSDERKRRRRRS